MARTPKIVPGMPTRKQVLDFIQNSAEPAGKREIAKAFGLKGQEKIQLKALLRDMADEGLIDGNRTAFHRMGGVPKVTVLRVVDIDEGEAIAVPDTWQPDDATPPPRLRLVLLPQPVLPLLLLAASAAAADFARPARLAIIPARAAPNVPPRIWRVVTKPPAAARSATDE